MNDPRNKELASKVLSKLKELCDKSQNIAYIISNLKITRGINAAIFGGACRDWYLDKEPKDIDIIIECEDPKSPILDYLILGADEVKKNKFDGYKLILDGVSFDVWKLHDARQFKELNLEPSFDNLMKTVPLSTDQIVVTLKGQVYEAGFWQTFDSQTIELVNDQDPDKEYIAARAYKFASKYGWKFSEKTQNLLDQLGYKKANVLINGKKIGDGIIIKNSPTFDGVDFGALDKVTTKHSSGNKNIGTVVKNYVVNPIQLDYSLSLSDLIEKEFQASMLKSRESYEKFYWNLDFSNYLYNSCKIPSKYFK